MSEWDELETTLKPKKPRDHSSEYSLQVYVMRYLDGKIRTGKNVLHVTPPFPEIKKAWHCFNGRHEDDGFFLKELGVRPGVHDLHLIFKGGYATIELKVGNNKQSEYQRDFTSKMIECGHNTGVCYSVAEVRDKLISWGLTCKNTHCIEPPIPLAQKLKLMHDFQAPRRPK